MSELRVGQRVIVDCPSSPHDGKECTVLGPLEYIRGRRLNGSIERHWVHHVDLPPIMSRRGDVYMRPRDLRPIDGDSSEHGSWDELKNIWQPREKVVQS